MKAIEELRTMSTKDLLTTRDVVAAEIERRVADLNLLTGKQTKKRNGKPRTQRQALATKNDPKPYGGDATELF